MGDSVDFQGQNSAASPLEIHCRRPILSIAHQSFVNNRLRALRVSTLIVRGTGQPD
jgi:hypothetical protein